MKRGTRCATPRAPRPPPIFVLASASIPDCTDTCIEVGRAGTATVAGLFAERPRRGRVRELASHPRGGEARPRAKAQSAQATGVGSCHRRVPPSPGRHVANTPTSYHVSTCCPCHAAFHVSTVRVRCDQWSEPDGVWLKRIAFVREKNQAHAATPLRHERGREDKVVRVGSDGSFEGGGAATAETLQRIEAAIVQQATGNVGAGGQH